MGYDWQKMAAKLPIPRFSKEWWKNNWRDIAVNGSLWLFFLSLVAILILLAAGAPNDKDSRRLLESQGYNNITTSEDMFLSGCDRSEFFRTKFTATNALGEPVSGVVCGGTRNGMSIRFR